MSKVLCTFSGKYGDILWSLPTVREISRRHQTKVDFQMMMPYESLIELLQDQDYINRANTNYAWACEGSPHGDQPWLPQNWQALNYVYEHVYHLTYKSHPGIGGKALPLIDFIADQQGIEFTDNPIPFIACPYMYSDLNRNETHIAYSFNSDNKAEKSIFLTLVQDKIKIKFVDVSRLSWQRAAYTIHTAIAFIGCRSSNWVVANGVGQKHIFIYEPNPARHKQGRFGYVFGCPYESEETAPIGCTPDMAASYAIEYLQNVELLTDGRQNAFT